MAKVSNRAILSIDFGKNGNLEVFRSRDDVLRFVERETSSSINHALPASLRSRFESAMQAGRNVAVTDEASIHAFKEALERAYQPHDQLAVPMSTSPLGQLVQRMNGQVGGGAMAAYAGEVPPPRQIPSNEYLQGVIEYHVFNAPSPVDAIRSTLEETIRQIVSKHDQLIERYSTTADIADTKLMDATTLAQGVWRRAARRQFELNQRIRKAFSSAETDIRNVEKTYTLHMGLQAPVEYWKRKHTKHSRDAVTYRTNLILFAMFGSGGVALGLWAIAGKIHEATTQNATAGALAYGTLGLLLTTVALWAGRILVRLYMSEHHLAIDAEERATMIETYLALQLKQQVDQKDLLVVLNGMFRPTADGIVKDDAAPELGAAGLLSKLLNK